MAPLADARDWGQRRSSDHGETPFKTPRTLWSIKTGRVQEDPAGPAARRGRELERFARRAYERKTGIQMEPLCLVHQEFEWMRASLDGLSFDGSTLLEIKCPLSLRDRVSAQEGRIPSQYHAQLQHQLEVSRAQQAHYWSFHGTDGFLIEIRPDREYAKRLVEAEATFWQLVKENRWPELANEELDLSADPEWRHAALRYREVKTPAGKRSVRGAPAARDAGAHGDREADLRLWRRSLEELAQRRG